jgi:hypothetical protein
MPKGVYKRNRKVGYIDDSGVGHIPLTRGLWALCDAHWFHILSQFNWSATKSGKGGSWYAIRNICLPNGKRTTQPMHRFIMGVTELNIEVDHKNREATLDNRESNLRVATRIQNANNRGRNEQHHGFKGTTWRKDIQRWQVQIGFEGGKNLYLGCFKTAIEAAAVYNFAAKRLHGDFVVLNDLSQVMVMA